MSDVTDLKAEVLLLRRENAELRDEIKHLLIKRQHTEDVSDRLRELADRMLGSIRRFEVCSDSYNVSSVYEQWMRELGVDE